MSELLEPKVLKSMHDYVTVYTHNIATGEISEPMKFSDTPDYIEIPTVSRIQNGKYTVGHGAVIFVFNYDEEGYKEHLKKYDEWCESHNKAHKEYLHEKCGLSKDRHEQLYNYVYSNSTTSKRAIDYNYKLIREIEYNYKLLCKIFSAID